MSQFISLTEAHNMTTLYRQYRETILEPEYQSQDILAISETFDKADVETVLGHSGCEGLRVYYGMDENFRVHAILVGVNGDNEDMLPPANPPSPAPEDEHILERGLRCPDMCGPESPLNS